MQKYHSVQIGDCIPPGNAPLPFHRNHYGQVSSSLAREKRRETYYKEQHMLFGHVYLPLLFGPQVVSGLKIGISVELDDGACALLGDWTVEKLVVPPILDTIELKIDPNVADVNEGREDDTIATELKTLDE
jgi:hypothetical protein